MSWFGWLTKTRFEVTGLDHVVMFAELGAVIAIVVIVWLPFYLRSEAEREARRRERLR